MIGIVLVVAITCVGGGISHVTVAANNATAAADSREAGRARAIRFELDREAARLEIRASQTSAWNDYAKVVVATTSAPPPDDQAARPADNLGAGELTHLRAQRAQAMAQRLTQLADATGKLEAVLAPEQRDVFSQIVRSQPSFGGPQPFGPPGGPGPESCIRDHPGFGRPPMDGVGPGGPWPFPGRGDPMGGADGHLGPDGQD